MHYIPALIINSSLSETDCSRSRMFRQGKKILAQQVRVEGESRASQFVSLPIVIAVLASSKAAEEAINRIRYGIRTGKSFVDLTDLE